MFIKTVKEVKSKKILFLFFASVFIIINLLMTACIKEESGFLDDGIQASKQNSLSAISYADLGLEVLTGMAACDYYLAISDQLNGKLYFYDRDFNIIGENTEIGSPGRICSSRNRVFVQDVSDQTIWVLDENMIPIKKIPYHIDMDNPVLDPVFNSMIEHQGVLYVALHTFDVINSGIWAIEIESGQQFHYGGDFFKPLFDGALVEDPLNRINDVYILDYTNLVEDRNSMSLHPKVTSLRKLNPQEKTISEKLVIPLPPVMEGEGVFAGGMIYQKNLLLYCRDYGTVFLYDLEAESFYGCLFEFSEAQNSTYNTSLFGDKILISQMMTKHAYESLVRDYELGHLFYFPLESLKE